MVGDTGCPGHEFIEDEGTFEYDQARLPYRVLLTGIPVSRCRRCGERRVTIPDPEGLHRNIASYITAVERMLLPEEMRFLRRYLDWSARKLATVMGVDEKTVSRWENGRQKMGPVAERLLRLIVRQHLGPDGATLSDDLFARLQQRRPKRLAAVKLTAARTGWRPAA